MDESGIAPSSAEDTEANATLQGKCAPEDMPTPESAPSDDVPLAPPDAGPEIAGPEQLRDSSAQAADFLKALANPHRLQILCHLCDEEKCVSELEGLVQLPQPRLSQQLARLREQGLVRARRDSKQIFYSLDTNLAKSVINLLHRHFCDSP